MNDNFTVTNFRQWFDKNYFLYLDFNAEIYNNDIMIYEGAVYNIPYIMIKSTHNAYVVDIYQDTKKIYINIICGNIKNQ